MNHLFSIARVSAAAHWDWDYQTYVDIHIIESNIGDRELMKLLKQELENYPDMGANIMGRRIKLFVKYKNESLFKRNLVEFLNSLERKHKIGIEKDLALMNIFN